MSSPLPAPDAPPPPPPAWREFARAPLVPVALAVTVGLLVDRYIGAPLGSALLVSALALAGWYSTRIAAPRTAFGWLLLCCVAVGAAHHHAHCNSFGPDDISTFAKAAPAAVTVRGVLADEPDRYRPPRPDPLLTVQREASSAAVLEVREIEGETGPQPASGRVRLAVEGRLDDVHCGDVVQVTGRLSLPEPPLNPGERDRRSLLLDHRITAVLSVRRGVDTVVRVESGWRESLFGRLAALRGWGGRVLQRHLPDESGLAAALILGDSTALERDEWDAFVRTGVIHVLAISGQHLVILGWFLWLLLRVCGVRTRHAAWAVALFLLAYALLTGARPSAVRAAVMTCAVCGGYILRRRVIPPNALALAWLIVVAVNPADPFTAGCQLSFLSVFVLMWGAARWLEPRELTPVELLIQETRGPVERAARVALRLAWQLVVVNAIMTVLNAPLVLAWQNVASPVAILLGPPLVVLTAVALVAGFLLLVVSPLGLYVAWPLARLTEWPLAACEWLVHRADGVSIGHFYAPGPPLVWLIGFYALVVGAVLLSAAPARRWATAAAVWAVLGLLLSFQPRESDETRVAFLAVGHGGCVVIETPDGRVLLYDAGTTAGPDAVRRVIAPYLWNRGISRIDEVFLSHADLDHFNAVPELLRRFPIGRVTTTPSFAEKESPGVEATLSVLEAGGVPRRVVVAGERFDAGSVSFEVLHPPRVGPPGNENARSLVLLMRYEGRSVLLTGDLEGEGQALATAKPVPPVDVMLAPHHGAKNANAPRGTSDSPQLGVMAAWARPALVVSSQRAGPTDHLRASYGGAVYDTPTSGTVTVRVHRSGVVASAFRTGGARVVGRDR